MKNALLAALALLSCPLLLAAEAPQQIDVHNLPGGAKVIEDVVVPVPSEIFNVLDKIGKPHWTEVLRPVKGTIKSPSEREQLALLLGTVIAEGFIAVEAEKTEEVKNIGSNVLSLSTSLGVKKTIKARASAIIDGADKKNWRAVRVELDKAQHEVQDAMREMNDQDYAQLVSLGGWLRGTEALAQVVKEDYKRGGADLLHQPTLVDFFSRRIDAAPKKVKDRPLVAKLRKALGEIKPLMGTEGGVISEKTVEDIRVIAEDCVKSIQAKSNP